MVEPKEKQWSECQNQGALDEIEHVEWGFSPEQWQALRDHLAKVDQQLLLGLSKGHREKVHKALCQGASWTKSLARMHECLGLALGHQDPLMLEWLLARSTPESFHRFEEIQGQEPHRLLALAIEKEAEWALPVLVRAGLPLGGCRAGSALRLALREGNTEIVRLLLKEPTLSLDWRDGQGEPLSITEHPLFLARTPEALEMLWNHWDQNPACLWSTTEAKEIYHPPVPRNVGYCSLHDFVASDVEAGLVIRRDEQDGKKKIMWVDEEMEATIRLMAGWGAGWHDRHLGMSASSNPYLLKALDEQGLDWHAIHEGMTALQWVEARCEVEEANHWSGLLEARASASKLAVEIEGSSPSLGPSKSRL